MEDRLLRQWNDWFPASAVDLSPSDLALYSGEDQTRPIYLGIDGEVFDVTSSKRMYGPGGAYHCFAGRDAARAFVTGCFETHLTHDLRGLSPTDLEGLAAWKTFFRTHRKYRRVGRVKNPTIHADTPIPKPCKPVVPVDVANTQRPLPVVQTQ
ncbi:cytochrome b5-like heme/steroid binding domain-containing protein [Filobasidium floriforme]|uniref:cytochrome b5-like heme/steroid binding domain-containing protein n=1 Tax=Filobasidium floriforme TaxID=5210 RepID=UPI001E8D628F|nr:cytochrome b5-like heme/steroid binding domain-containing protein [Filobasidium floriforme]KAH8089285.1 cytochrome b5-like heme/steroid binding domain-containing protein [Filobasidium floriforme]